MVIVLVVVIVGLWFLLAEAFHISPNAAAFAGEFSGALFTLGGLVIALASVVTLLSVENRVREAFKRAEVDVNLRFERQVTSQIEAHLAFFRATLAGNWQEAEQQAEEAIAKYPQLPGVRSFVALKMFDEVEATFYLVHHDFQDNLDPRVFRPRPNMGVSPLSEAGVWLRSAIEHDDQVRRCRAALAQWYGMSQRYDKMREQLALLSTEDRKNLVQPIKIATMAYSCFPTTEERLRQVGIELSIELPVAVDQVNEWLLNQAGLLRSSPYGAEPYFQWWVVPRIDINSNDRLDYPRTIMIRLLANREDGWQASATYYMANGEHNVPSERAESQSFDEIMRQLHERFLFLCPDDLEETRKLVVDS